MMNLPPHVRFWSHRVALGLIVAAVTVSPASAQFPPYVFTRIADNITTDPNVAGANCVGVNAGGLVVLKFGSTGSSHNELWLGDGHTFTKAADITGSFCGSLNDLGELAYGVLESGVTRLVRNANGTITTLARSDVAPYYSGGITYLPSLANTGSAVFQSNGEPGPGTGAGIYIGPSGTKVYNVSTDIPLVSFTTSSMNDSGVVAFLGQSTDGRIGIYRNSDLPLIETGDSTSLGQIGVSLHRPVINNDNRVAFVGSIVGEGTPTVFSTVDGVNIVRLGSGVESTAPISLNDSGVVAFRKTGGGVEGIFLGRPGAPDRKLIQAGDAIDDSTLQIAFLWEEALNNLGQVAFKAHLANGRQGVYRADPQWLKSLTFIAKAPACGPVLARITLNAKAPVGGLIVHLTSTNAAASVPASVFVPAGKTAVTFEITPTAVTSNSTGIITATIGPQSRQRSFTVRPITVKSLLLSPNPVTGGSPVTGTITLDCAAAPGDISVALSSTKATIAHPDVATVLIPAGATTQGFSITTNSVTATTAVTIRASANGILKSAKLTVNP